MSDTPEMTPDAPADDDAALRERLLECARMLRSARHMEPAAQTALADLMAELAACADLHSPTVPAHQIAETSAQLVQALHEPQDRGLVAAARHRLEAAAARAEASAPVATGIARRLIDALSGIGV